MDPVTEKLALTAIGTIFGYGFKSSIDFTIEKLWKMASLRKFWGFLETPTVVFIPTKPASAGEFGPAVGYGTGLALAELQVLGKKIFPKMPELIVTSDFHRLSDHNDKSVIVLGGGKYNRAYLELINELRPTMHFFDTKDQDFKEIRNEGRTITFNPEYSNGCVVSDLGLILRSKRLSSEREVLILAGSYTYGTWGAMKYLSIAKNVRPMLKHIETGFEFVVRCRMDGNNISNLTAESTLRKFRDGARL